MSNDFCKIIARANNDKVGMRVVEFNNKEEKSYALYFFQDDTVLFENYYMEDGVKQLHEDFVNMQEIYFGVVIQKYFTFEEEKSCQKHP